MTAEEFKALSSWDKVRTLTGIVSGSGEAVMTRMALICLISRVELGDADPDFLNEIIDKAFPAEKQSD